MAIPAPQALTYRQSKQGTINVFAAAANYVRTSRSGGQPLFSREDRTTALAEDEPSTVAPVPPNSGTVPAAAPPPRA